MRASLYLEMRCIGKRRTHFCTPKLEGNRVRDFQNQAKLMEAGWGLLVIWECEVNDGNLAERIRTFLEDTQ